MWAWRSATAARTARIGTLHDGRRWPSTKIGEAADEEAIGPVRFRRAGALLCRRIGARADARAARCPGCSGIFAGDVPGAIASSDAARGQNPRAGNDRCAGRRNHGAGAEVRGSMVRPVRAQAAVGHTGSWAIDRRNDGEGVGGRTGERRRPVRLARPSIERSSVCAEKGAVVLRVNLEGNNRLPRDSVRHERVPVGRDLAESASETAVDVARAFSIVTLGKRAPMPYVWLPRRAMSIPQRTFGAPRAASQKWWKCLTL
jgi:hypothetical protein